MGKKISFEMQNKTIRKVFKERDDFIIIGLTGAIGEGLKDIANIMQKNFNEFYLPEYSSDGDFMQQLEYSVVYTFAEKALENLRSDSCPGHYHNLYFGKSVQSGPFLQ